jgi:uncharacterized protein (TIGR00730 family)
MSIKFNRICVFCGSSSGVSPEYQKSVYQLGKYLANQEIELVYGGGNIGLMGEISRAVMDHGGKAIGVIPKKIYERVQHLELTELHIVESMHERKAKMYELADGFIALPGGIGTLEELAEVITWHQIGYHDKPIGLFNVNRFYDSFINLLHHMADEGFFKSNQLDNIMIDDLPEELVTKMATHESTYVDKWEKQ